MKTSKKIFFASLLLGSIGLGACDKEFLDINTDPTLPGTASPDLVLPSGTGNLLYVMGSQFQIVGNFWAQHWTQSLVANQYKALDKYEITQNSYDGTWQTLYAGALNDFRYVMNRSKGDSANYGVIAGLLSAYTFQTISDAYDKAPFTDALNGISTLQPKYDDGPVIYDGIIQLIDGSLAKINTNTPVKIGIQDLVFEGDMDKWRRFANTLKLRVYLRQVYARPDVAAAGIRALYANNAQFLSATEDAQISRFTALNKNSNPLYLTEVYSGSGVRENIIASATAIDYLSNSNDTRIDDLFDRPNNSATAAHVGTRQGFAGIPGAPADAVTTKSRPDMVKIAGPVAPVILISGAESLFLQAEASLRGYTSTATPKVLYDRAVTASFTRLGRAVPSTFLSSAEIDLDKATGFEAKLDRIITQKWVSMSGSQGFEAWTELRRTGYPSFIVPSVSSSLPTGIIANRFLYPTSETQRNPNTPKVVQTDVQLPVWWDKK